MNYPMSFDNPMSFGDPMAYGGFGSPGDSLGLYNPVLGMEPSLLMPQSDPFTAPSMWSQASKPSSRNLLSEMANTNFIMSPTELNSWRGNEQGGGNSDSVELMKSIPKKLVNNFTQQFEFIGEFPDMAKETIVNSAIAHRYYKYLSQLFSVFNAIEAGCHDVLGVDQEHFKEFKSILYSHLGSKIQPEARRCMRIIQHSILNGPTHKHVNLFKAISPLDRDMQGVCDIWKDANPTVNSMSLNASPSDFGSAPRLGPFHEVNNQMKPNEQLEKMGEFHSILRRRARRRHTRRNDDMRYLIYLLAGEDTKNRNELHDDWWSKNEADSLLRQSRCATLALHGVYEGVVAGLNSLAGISRDISKGGLKAPSPLLRLWRDAVLTNLGLSFYDSASGGGVDALKEIKAFTKIEIKDLELYCKPHAKHPQKSYAAYRVLQTAKLFSQFISKTSGSSRQRKHRYADIMKRPDRVFWSWLCDPDESWCRVFDDNAAGRWVKTSNVSGVPMDDLKEPVRA